MKSVQVLGWRQAGWNLGSTYRTSAEMTSGGSYELTGSEGQARRTTDQTN